MMKQTLTSNEPIITILRYELTTAVPSKNAVSANIKHSIDTPSTRQISGQSTTVVKGCMHIMFDIVDTAFSFGRALIICEFIQESFKVKESSLHEIWNADTAFLLSGADDYFTHVKPTKTRIFTTRAITNNRGVVSGTVLLVQIKYEVHFNL